MTAHYCRDKCSANMTTASASSSLSSSMSLNRSFTKESNSVCIIRQGRLVIGSLMLAIIMALGWHSHQLHRFASVSLDVPSRKLHQQDELNYMDIVEKAYTNSFAHLQWCPDDLAMDQCLRETFDKLHDDNVPWWFQTMLRDAPSVIHLQHHNLSAPTRNKRGLRFCTIGKIGTKHWRRLICRLQNKPSNRGRNVCIPDTAIPENAPKAVFLRDPLERFLSAYIDKCVSWRKVERHCEPLAVFDNEENGLTEGLNKSKKLLFETYVDTMPLKWNMHFIPQRYDDLCVVVVFISIHNESFSHARIVYIVTACIDDSLPLTLLESWASTFIKI